MKIDAKIKWLIDEPELGIEVDKIETVPVDVDYIEPMPDEVIEWVENELAEKYGVSFYMSQDDFLIMNLDELIEDFAF